MYGYRKYFTDKKRGAVLRLSRDGMTEISSYGMHDHFRDELSNTNNDVIVGGWDNHSKSYVISIQDSRFLGTSQTGQTSGVITSPSNNVTLTLNGAKSGVSGEDVKPLGEGILASLKDAFDNLIPVSYTHLRAHET